MITYFDTSVVMGLLDPNQEIHQQAAELFRMAKSKGKVATTTLHTYSELYNNLTKKGGGRPGLPPQTVARLLNDKLDLTFEMVELSKADYKAAISRSAGLNIPGPIIYDALHYQAALKAGATVLYTDNLRDFTRLQLPEDKLVVKGVRQ